ncbi:adenylosuccinate synthetase [Candidatus Woesearchaeota archaeon]|nr:adenylosuccinate synthetase [Candidatus Woesearchaeota archaeon]
MSSSIQKDSLEERTYRALRALQIPPIPDLDFIPDTYYRVVHQNRFLNRLIEDNDVVVIVGAHYGDEGKGKLVDAVAHDPRIRRIARANSGENAGHTVVHNGKKYVFHLAPSGLLLEDKLNYIGPRCVMDPISFWQDEIQPLLKEGREDILDRLFIGNVQIVLPTYKLIDLVGKPPNTSTLRGMSEAHAAMVSKSGIKLEELLNWSEQEQKKVFTRAVQRYYDVLRARGLSNEDVLQRCLDENQSVPGRVPQHVIRFVQAEDKVDFLFRLYQEHVARFGIMHRGKRQYNLFRQNLVDVKEEIREALANGEKILVEGAQSYFLSNSVDQTAKYGTSADTTAMGTLAALGINVQKHRTKIINIGKVPSSRVGAGPNPGAYVPQTHFSRAGIDSLAKLGVACDEHDRIRKLFFASINPQGLLEPGVFEDDTGRYYIGPAMAISEAKQFGEKGATTGKPRVLGPIDCVALAEVMRKQGPLLSISAVDRYDGYEQVPLVIAYIYYHPERRELITGSRTYRNGDIIMPGDRYPNSDVLYHCHPIIKLIPGWRGSPIAASAHDKQITRLPLAAQRFIAEIEHYTGARVFSIGNGPEPDNLIYLERRSPLHTLLRHMITPRLTYVREQIRRSHLDQIAA